MIQKWSQNDSETALNNWTILKSECKMIIQEFAKFRKKQSSIEAKSLRCHLAWINKKIYSGQTCLQADKIKIEESLRAVENSLWAQELSVFEEKWLFREGTSSKEFLYLEDLYLSKKEISKLYDTDGIVLSTTDQILL